MYVCANVCVITYILAYKLLPGSSGTHGAHSILCTLYFVAIGQLPRVSVEDPERIRVDSVFETLVCVSVL